jgi:5,6-dimethylbenzimidazole synthase
MPPAGPGLAADNGGMSSESPSRASAPPAADTIPARPFTEVERTAVYRAIHERRDMRHFCGGEVAPDVLLRLLRAAHHAPSVGFMQPWRFIRVRDAQLRQDIHAVIEQERLQTARAQGFRLCRNGQRCRSASRHPGPARPKPWRP